MKKVRLEDVSVRGSSNLAQKDIEGMTGVYPIYGASGYIGNVDFYHQEEEYIAVVKDGAGIGRTMFLPAKSSVIGTLQYIIPKESILAKYLYYAVKKMKLERYYTGATIPHIYYKDYKKETFWLPDIHEQQKVVYVLEKVEKMIDELQRALIDLDTLVKSRFVELFGDPVSNPCRLPEATLPELGELGRGVSKHRPRNAPELLGGSYPLIQTGEVASANLYITSYSNTYSEMGFRQSKMWNKGTLCITIAANIAKTAILGFDACFPDSVVGFNANERTNNIYIHYWFSFFQTILEAQAPESAQKNINLKILNELKVIVPSVDKQNEFADFVRQIDKLKVTTQKTLEKLQLLFDALMQEYFKTV